MMEKRSGKYHGHGTYVCGRRWFIRCDLAQGVKQCGRRVFRNGTTYSGDYKNGFMHGEGTMCMANGDVYVMG